jgi:hypothetical protein
MAKKSGSANFTLIAADEAGHRKMVRFSIRILPIWLLLFPILAVAAAIPLAWKAVQRGKPLLTDAAHELPIRVNMPHYRDGNTPAARSMRLPRQKQPVDLNQIFTENNAVGYTDALADIAAFTGEIVIGVKRGRRGRNGADRGGAELYVTVPAAGKNGAVSVSGTRLTKTTKYPLSREVRISFNPSNTGVDADAYKIYLGKDAGPRLGGGGFGFRGGFGFDDRNGF